MKSSRFVVDLTAPAAPLISNSEQTTTIKQFTVRGQKEAGSAVLQAGQVIVAANAQTSWSATVALAAGKNSLQFQAQDQAGHLEYPLCSLYHLL